MHNQSWFARRFAVVGALLWALALGTSAARADNGKLVWSDDFAYTGLPDAKKWGYEQGYVRNNEAQFYTKERTENARVENGTLILECRKEHYAIPEGSPGSKGKKFAEYTAAALETRGLASWQYGRIEVKAQVPQGNGVWPAIWMLGDNIPKVGWPKCGEIDIMEFVGKDPGKIHGTLHFSKDGKHQSIGKSVAADKPWEDFHVYAVDWTPERIDIYFDQTKYKTIDLKQATDKGDNAFQKPFYLILNFALGGSWGGKIDDAMLPQKFLIKYVHIYEMPAEQAKP